MARSVALSTISPSTFSSATSWSATTSASSESTARPISESRPPSMRRHQRSANGPGPIAARTLKVATRSAAAPSVKRGLLHRTGEQALDEVALQAEEHDQRDEHHDERRRREQVPLRGVGPEEAGDLHRHRLPAAWREHQRDEQVVPDPQEL